MIVTYLIEVLDFDVAFAIEQFAAARYNKKKLRLHDVQFYG